ncbi:MAG TPA: alpha/beta fold hydrolase, partial [Puia sp.]|nr:alpha/beta fold hydrolase [Puia sp.]
MSTQPTSIGHFAPIGDLQLYYELWGSGQPLVLLHGGGSTIESTYGRILPLFAKTHTVIAVELQAHGRTRDIDRPLSFEHDADDVAALLGQLGIAKADFMGFSNGGTTCLQMAIRHPELVNKLVLASAIYRRDGMPPGFFEGFPHARLEHMPGLLQEAFLDVNPDPDGLQVMFDRDVTRMMAFRDIRDADIKAIKAPALVLNGDAEVVRAEHAMALSRVLPHAKLAILPGGHGDYIGEICSPYKNNPLPALVTAMIGAFLRGFFCFAILALSCAGVWAQTGDSVRLSSLPRPLFWENAPVRFEAGKDHLLIVAGEKTDMFRDPNVAYNTDNAPKLLFMADSNFVLTAAIHHAFASKWDGGAIVLKADSLNWIKFCFEKDYTGQKRVVSVVTRGISDDCNSAPVVSNTVYYKIAKAGNVITLYYSVEGRHWYLIRHLQFDSTAPLKLGFLAQSPTGQRCTVVFSAIHYSTKKIGDPYTGE